jgi:hypothetical protein
MCKPGAVGRRRLRMHELAAHRLLTQDDRSGTAGCTTGGCGRSA